MDTNSILITILIVAVLLAALFFIPGWMLRRAVRQVIKIFRHYNAIDVANAKSDASLGLRPRPMLRRMMNFRDYKPYALTVMLRAGVVLQTEAGKFYLSEERLMNSTLRKLG